MSCDSVYPDLLIKQKQLIDLNIGFDLKKSSIFSEDFTDQVTFRLETLIVADPGLNDDNIDIEGKQKVLAKFINLHQHHLKYLHIWAPVQSTCMRTFLINLKFLQRLNLTLRDAGFEVDPELISQMKATKLPVKDLELEVNNSMYEAEVWNMHLLGKFIECFPNVCFLKLNFFTINNDEYALKVIN